MKKRRESGKEINNNKYNNHTAGFLEQLLVYEEYG